jgi:hypothetical protein
MRSSWKAGDTCTIKPCRLHGVAKAKCATLWTIDSLDSEEACVHNGAPGHIDIRTAPGLTCAARVPLSCLLPAGDAHPTIAAEMGTEVLRLRARVAELEATLANERGEGEPPCEGWAFSHKSDSWQAPHGIAARLSPERVKNEGWKAPYAWERWDTEEVQRGCAGTFRDAMRAASGAR